MVGESRQAGQAVKEIEHEKNNGEVNVNYGNHYSL